MSQNWVNRVYFQKHLTTPQPSSSARGGGSSAIYAFNLLICYKKTWEEPCIMILKTNVRYWLIDSFIDWLINIKELRARSLPVLTTVVGTVNVMRPGKDVSAPPGSGGRSVTSRRRWESGSYSTQGRGSGIFNFNNLF